MPHSRKQHSAKVDIRMTINGRVLGLSQVGPDHAILKQPTVIPPATYASIQVVIDDETLERTVFLFDGATENSRRVEFF